MLRLRLLILLGILGVVYLATLVRRDQRSRHTRVVALVPHASDGGMRVAGHVILDGAPLANARVELVGASAKTGRVDRVGFSDSGGAFDLGEVPFDFYQVTATAAAATIATEFIGPYTTDDRPLRFDQLQLAVSWCEQPVVGTVVDPSGTPLPGVQIGPDLIPVTTSAADGSFRVCAAEGSMLAFRDAGRGGVYRKVSASERLAVVLAPEASIEGRVVHDGRPLAGARVWVPWVYAPGDGEDGASAFAVTDADGRFRIDGLAAGNAVLNARAPGLERDAEPPDHLLAVVAGETLEDVVVTMRE